MSAAGSSDFLGLEPAQCTTPNTVLKPRCCADTKEGTTSFPILPLLLGCSLVRNYSSIFFRRVFSKSVRESSVSLLLFHRIFFTPCFLFFSHSEQGLLRAIGVARAACPSSMR